MLDMKIWEIKERNIWNKEELEPRFDTRKSFYKKAYIIFMRDDTILLQSYDTIIGVLYPNGEFEFGKYSYTSNRHLREFMRQFDIDLELYNTK
jgi:hypothetical protein